MARRRAGDLINAATHAPVGSYPRPTSVTLDANKGIQRILSEISWRSGVTNFFLYFFSCLFLTIFFLAKHLSVFYLHPFSYSPFFPSKGTARAKSLSEKRRRGWGPPSLVYYSGGAGHTPAALLSTNARHCVWLECKFSMFVFIFFS